MVSPNEFETSLFSADGLSIEGGAFLHATPLAGVIPLRHQTGPGDLKSVPDGLQRPLFDQPEGATTSAPLQSFAILDAAKINDLPQMLSQSGLPYGCLFQGKAEHELADVAPYLVQLEPDHALTRRLFTHDPQFADALVGLHLWQTQPGVFLRSRAGFAAVRAHLRKFTRLRDAQGKWFYFRFWEAGYSALFFAGNADSGNEVHAKFGGGVLERIVCFGPDEAIYQLTPDLPDMKRVGALPPNLIAHYLPVFARYKFALFLKRFCPDMAATLATAGHDLSVFQVSDLTYAALADGFDRESEIKAYILEAVSVAQPEGALYG